MSKLWTIQINQPNAGPKGGKKRDIVSVYHVLAESREQALAVFNEEMPAMIDQDSSVAVMDAGSRVVRGRS